MLNNIGVSRYSRVINRFFSLIFWSAVIIISSRPLVVQAYTNPGKPTGFVNDYASIIGSSDKIDLENKLKKFSDESSNEISVVTIKSLDGDYIEHYAVKLFEDWGIGKDKKDNGILLLIALDDRKMRIEVGYGLEGALPDSTANNIIVKTLKPAFQAGNYYQGINAAVDKIMAATRGEYQPSDSAQTQVGIDEIKNFKFDLEFFFWIGVFILYVLGALWRHLAKSKAWWEGGIIGSVLGFIIAVIFFRFLLVVIILPLVLGGFGLLLDFLVSNVWPKPSNDKKNRFWFLGGPGGFGGGSSGGFGGGGFGGFGGGGSGGGGSSGSW